VAGDEAEGEVDMESDTRAVDVFVRYETAITAEAPATEGPVVHDWNTVSTS
jgi:hypothetical protein